MANLRANSIVGVGSTDAGVVFDGVTKIKTQNYFYLQTGNTENRFPNFATNAVSAASARGVFGGGFAPTVTNTIEYITIATTGNATDFGDLTVSRFQTAALSDGHGGLS